MQASQGSRFTAIAEKDLRAMIIARWPAIHSDLPARDPSVVEFIRILREMGRRDGPGALAFLDQLDRYDKDATWIMARLAVAGGWSISDPKAATIALMEENFILPEGYSNFAIVDKYSVKHPQIAIERTAAHIFKLWLKDSPNEALHCLNDLSHPTTKWNSVIIPLLKKEVPITHQSPPVNQNSIDAILNNPARTQSPENIYGRPIFGETDFPGELAFTHEEWAARNQNLAIEKLGKR